MEERSVEPNMFSVTVVVILWGRFTFWENIPRIKGSGPPWKEILVFNPFQITAGYGKEISWIPPRNTLSFSFD